MTLIEWYIPGISGTSKYKISLQPTSGRAAATAAKSLQLCPTLCNPIDGSPPSSPIPGILQARTLEWVAISFSNARKWKMKVKMLSRVRLLATPWTAAHTGSSIHGIFQAGVLEWGAIAFSLAELLQIKLYYRLDHSPNEKHWRK